MCFFVCTFFVILLLFYVRIFVRPSALLFPLSNRLHSFCWTANKRKRVFYSSFAQVKSTRRKGCKSEKFGWIVKDGPGRGGKEKERKQKKKSRNEEKNRSIECYPFRCRHIRLFLGRLIRWDATCGLICRSDNVNSVCVCDEREKEFSRFGACMTQTVATTFCRQPLTLTTTETKQKIEKEIPKNEAKEKRTKQTHTWA